MRCLAQPRVQAHARPGTHRPSGTRSPANSANGGAAQGEVHAVVLPRDTQQPRKPGRPAAEVALSSVRPTGDGNRRAPATTSPARRSTAEASPSSPQTAFMHQCIPYVK